MFEPDPSEMVDSGAKVPLFWYTDNICRTRTDPRFKVDILSQKNSSKTISCIKNITHETIELVTEELETFQTKGWDFKVRLEEGTILPQNSVYCIIMIDPDAPSAKSARARYWLHWIVTDIQLDGLHRGIKEIFKPFKHII